MNIGKYQIIDTIGKGGMGVVYKALDPRIERTVAIKTLSARFDPDPELRNRLLMEARSAGSLSHKNIVTIYEMDEADGIGYIAMEFLDGFEMKEHIAQRTPMSLEQKLRIMVEICEGLAHAHSKGVVHGDIKPGNIFLTRTGQVKILDFGLARMIEADAAHRSLAGTPSYMSPEEVRGDAPDHRSDIFSFGVVCYELLTHTKPFDADSDYAVTYKIIQSEPEALDKVVPDLPPELETVIAKALAKDPGARYQNIEDMLNELEIFRLTLDDRKQRLRQENLEAIAELERRVCANPELLCEAAPRLEELKRAPENRDGSRSDGGTGWKRTSQFDYLALAEQRNRIGRERDKLDALLDKRKRSSYLLLEVQDLNRNGQLENALQLLNYVVADDPTYGEAATLQSELSARLDQEREERERLGQAQELYAKATAAGAAGDLAACASLLTEALGLNPTYPEALALLGSTRDLLRQRAELNETRNRQALVAARDRLDAGDIAGARMEVASAVEIGGPSPAAAELTLRIERAEQEVALREQRREERRARIAALLESARQSLSTAAHTDAVRLANEALTLEPACAEAVDLRKEALAALEAEHARTERRTAGEKEKIAGFKLLGEGKYRESRAALNRAAEWLGDNPVVRVGIEEAETGMRQQELQAAVEAGLMEARQLFITDAHDAAEAQVSRVLELSPRNEEASTLLAKIQEARRSKRAEPALNPPLSQVSGQLTTLNLSGLPPTVVAGERGSRTSVVAAVLILICVVALLAYFFLIRP